MKRHVWVNEVGEEAEIRESLNHLLGYGVWVPLGLIKVCL